MIAIHLVHRKSTDQIIEVHEHTYALLMLLHRLNIYHTMLELPY